MDREGALALVRRVLALSPAEQTELILTSAREELTRFAGNAITQNVATTDESLSIRLISGRREGKAETNQFDEKSLRKAVDAAWNVVRLAREDPLLPPLLERQPAYRTVEAASASTAETSPAARARVVAEACARCRREGLEASGIFSTAGGITAYANSRGVFGYHPSSAAAFSVTAIGEGGATEGWALGDAERVVRTAIEKARRGKDAVALAPGRYTVVLEPAAVSELFLFLGWMGFGAQRYQEGRSYLKAGGASRLGQKLFSSKLSVRDDVYHDAIRGMPFDYEGTAREVVPLIEGGVAKGLLWDRRTAAREQNGKRSTGHGLPQPNAWGPGPAGIVVEGGDATVADLVRGVERGLLVTKFHYTNIVDPMELSITGMTRSGLYLIEDGEVARAVKNFRFTVSLLDIFSEENLEALGKAERTGGALFSSSPCYVPAMRIRSFNMSSATDF
jgi:PmbA protein